MRRGTGLGLFIAFAIAISIAVASNGGSSDRAAAATDPPSTAGLHATIRRTTHGIPHILSSNFAGLGYGYGYAFAQDNLCVLAETYVTVNGERSRYFGPDASYTVGGNGSVNNNLTSDFFYPRIIDNGTIEHLLSLAPPLGPRSEIKAGVRGFVAGYNRWLRDTGVDNISDPSCRGKPWVRPITEMDAYRRFYQLGLIASQGVAIDGIGAAQPPTGPAASPTSAEQAQMIGELKQKLPLGGVGSNAIGLGKDATDNGHGMMLGNPHFPWDGSERFYEAQLTIPGVVNAEGGSLFGVPLVLIGHTDNLAWSHTVSTAYRFTPFEETLVPGSPTTYLYDGQPRQMKAEEVTVTVKNPDGTLEQRSRTLYSTHHGPIFNSLLGLDLFPWTPAKAFSMGDANATNFRYLNHFLEVNMAQSVTELDEIIHRNQGIPWVNTLAADSSGKAYYADISVTPNVPNAKANICNTQVGQGTYAALGLPVLRAWDLHDDLDSNGAILFRRFASRALGAVPVTGTPGLFTNQFDANNPVHTPNGLNIANPAVEQSFADAVSDLRSSGIPLDAPLRGYQYERRGAERIPIHGGPGGVGVFNAINVGWVAGQGYPNVPHGSSYVYTAQFTGNAQCPVDTRSILTYSLSTNPNSPYFADQTRMFSNKQWVDEAYCDDEIAADPNLQITEISEGFPRPRGATPLRVPLVPAYKACASPNRAHGAPLAFPSCSGPAQVSQALTVGTPDANGRPAASIGTVLFNAISCPLCAYPLNADVRINASLTDVRNKAGLGDYAGQLEGRFSLRLTDRFNAANPGDPQTDAATVLDRPFKFGVPCQATSSSAGSTCQVNTTANALLPGSVRDGDRAIWELGPVGLYDSSGSLFAAQGVFVP
jgi:acyl-homoserine lactone acylase PvdQ